jgi:uncharacterized repeat protein (TIGR01451 family)
VLKENGAVNFSSSALSLATLGTAMVGHQAIVHLSDYGAFTALQFLVVAFGVFFFDSRGRHEFATILTFGMIGINVGMIAAGSYNTELDTIYTMPDDSLMDSLNLQRQALGYVFFSYLTIFVALGLLTAVLVRGVINPAGDEGWFSAIANHDGGYNKSTMPLQIATLVWILAHVGSLYHFDSVSMADKLGLTMVEGYHGHFGFWGAFFTGIVAMIVAGMASEKWYTRSMFIGSMWLLYLVSSWYEAGMWESEQLGGTWGALIWLGFTFFICVGIYMISTHEKYGGWANLDDHEASGARKFWDAHWASLMVGAAFFFGLVIRVQWYIVPSMNAFGTGSWDMTGGSDPWYMKRVVDYILANNAHLIFDADRSYPLGGVNPRPPLFTWSIALVSMLLEPMLGDDAVWYAILGLPAIYGALTIFPIASIAKDNFGKSTGVVAAWLIAFMPAHVSHSTWALADHDAFVMLFISMGFMFWFKAIKNSGNERLTKSSSPRIGAILHSFSVVAKEKRSAMSFAILAGVSFGVASLAWKGFVVGPSILFLAYFAQVALNMFRRKDSTTLNALFLAMLFSNLLMSLPFYGHPQMALVLDGTGLQPFLFILGFTLAISYVTTGFRDKPWLLVLGTLFAAATVFFTILFVLKQLELSNAWDVLFTGSGYFTKTKIFGTVAEANAPDRGQLFAQLGPIVLVLALTMGFYALWSTFRNKNQSHLFFGIWIFVATYMSWTAARFMFNATPAVAVMGAWGIIALWDKANWKGLVRTWKKFGIRTPADRIAGARRAVWRTPSFSAILLIVVLLGGQQFTYGLDSAIPGSDPSEDDIDENIYNIIPDALRWELAGFSILDSSAYSGNWYLGSFGSGFNDQGWNSAYDWMTEQDAQMPLSERPAFVSWWDYGFQALSTGAHPSVSDNFQSGIPASGNMLLARTQVDLVSMFIWQLAMGDIRYTQINTGDYELTNGFENIVDAHLDDAQFDLFETILEERDFDEMKEYIDNYAFTVIQTNEASQVQENSKNVMASGYHRVDGIADTSTLYYRMYQDGERIICDPEVSISCVDGDWSDFDDANETFNSNVRSGQETQYKTTHYIFGDYWYTNDLRDEFDSVSTHIHRHNTRLAMTVQLLNDVMTDSQVVDFYDDLIGMEGYYKVQDYNGLPGDTISRDHEIRYFAIDNRLYPRAGRYTADYNYNQGQPMGIFGAPTILSGQDISTFMDEVYETSRGSRNFEMTRAEVDDAMTNDFLDQQAGLDIDPLQVQDVRVDHNPAFFDTMLARTYVGYGASSLGVDSGFSNPQPAQHFGQSGSPGSILQQAVPLPGAMTNHFVISNWYNEDNNFSIGSANTLVKIMKYYSGAEISGSVTLSDNGEPLPGVRLLIERDAFSGEDSVDLDEDTYWIPIGFTDADENGEWSFHAPAGKIRVSAFVGTFDAEPARATIADGSYAQGINDLLTEENENRQVNAVTAILGNVANMTWLGETQYNVTGEQANRTEAFTDSMDIEVDSSGISGQLTWSGDDLFNGEPIVDTEIILRNIHETSDDVTLETTNGSFTTEETRIIQGTGQATFTENGTFESEGLASVLDFHGTFTRTIGDARTYVANGTWNGTGEIKASWIDLDTSFDVNCVVDSNDSTNITMPNNETVCLKDDTDELPVYMIDGEILANGRFTSVGDTILVQEHEGSSFEGIGFFEGTGTFNGTGRFVGSGDFSGPMVSPGSFYQTGLVPGEYEAYANLNNGREVKLTETVSVGINPSFDLSLTMEGSLLEGNLTNSSGEFISNVSFEVIDKLSADSVPVTIEVNETGGYKYGPLSIGEYKYSIDLDDDGFYESSGVFEVNSETELLNPISFVPDSFDITVNLISPLDGNGIPLIDTAEQNFTIKNSENFNIDVTSNADGEIIVELPVGDYTIEQTDVSEYYLFSSISITNQDEELDITYSIASEITGTILAYITDFDENWSLKEMEENTTQAENLPVVLFSGDYSFTTTTDSEGNFSIVVPGELEYVLKASSEAANYGLGINVVPSDNALVELGSIYLKPLITVTGNLFVHDNVTEWNAAHFNGQQPTILAIDENGVEWEAETSPSGEFTLELASGVYRFEGRQSEYNISPVESWNVTDNILDTTVNMTALIEPVEIQIYVCLSNEDIEQCDQNYPAFGDLSFTPFSLLFDSYTVNSSDFDENGNATLEILPGNYQTQLFYTDSSDENATDFNSFYQSQNVQVNFIDDDSNDIHIILANERLMSGQVEIGNSTLQNIQFLMYNESNDQWLSINTNETGNFSSYVPYGDWIMIIADYVHENETYVYRSPITISEDVSSRTGLSITMEESVELTLTLKEELTGENLSDIRITAVSNDGYGNITLEPSNSTGVVIDKIMPGSWDLYLDKETDDKRWYIESDAYTIETLGLTELDAGEVLVNSEVLIYGKIYWDFNENGIADFSELISEANITATSLDGNLQFEIKSNEDGVWSQLVPIQNTYNITVEKEGYSNGYYSFNGTDGVIVESEAKSFDINIDANNVQVNGIVTSEMQDEAASLDGASITLYPASDRNTLPVVVNGVYDSGVLTWSADVEPGNWVVVVKSQIFDENTGGISIDHLSANVAEGGTLEMVMNSGGYVEIETSWEDISLLTHHAGSAGSGAEMITSEVQISIDIGLESSWNYSLGENGDATILLPVGNFQVSSSFTTVQHERNLSMNYTATNFGIIEQGIVDIDLSYQRILDSKANLSINQASISNATYIETTSLTPIVDGDEYKVIEFDLDIDYLGTEVRDTLTISGTITETLDSQDWSVQFYNGTGWVDEMDIIIGIGDSLADDTITNFSSVKVRIMLPNVTSSLSLDNGHKVRLEATSESGSSGISDILISVPQYYGMEITDAITETGVSPGGTGTFSFSLTNTGNGDDSFNIELADNLPEGWQITPTTSTLTISKDDQRTQQFSIFAPESFTSSEIEASVTIISEDGVTSDTVNVTIQSARISLSVDETLSQELTKVYESQPGQIVVPISNSGYRTASTVLVTVNLTNDLGNEVLENIGNQTISVPAGQTINATFTLDQSSKKFNRYAISVDVLGEDNDFVEDSVEPFDYQEETILDTAEPTSGWFMVVIIVLTILVGYGGLKVARNKSSTRF